MPNLQIMNPVYCLEIRYSTQPRRKVYAVLRKDPKGGERDVAVWDNKPTALAICQLLNAAAATEVT